MISVHALPREDCVAWMLRANECFSSIFRTTSSTEDETPKEGQRAIRGRCECKDTWCLLPRSR